MVQQSPKLLHAVKERVKEKGSQEKIAGLVTNVCSADALGLAAADAVAPVVLEAFLADGLAERSPKVRARTREALGNAMHGHALGPKYRSAATTPCIHVRKHSKYHPEHHKSYCKIAIA